MTPGALVLGVIWDRLIIVPASKLKFDAGITIPKNAKGLDRFPVQEIPGGLFAVNSLKVAALNTFS